MYELAMFPLEHAMLPSTVIPLHIFEPRYRQLARDVSALEEPEFGVAMIERGREVGGDDQRSTTGVVARVLQAEEFPDGRWALLATGTRRIRIEEWLPDSPYPRALVDDWPDIEAEVDPARLAELFVELDRVLAAARRLAPEQTIESPPITGDDSAFALWQAVVAARLGPLDNQSLLLEPGTTSRLEVALRLLHDRAQVLGALADQDG